LHEQVLIRLTPVAFEFTKSFSKVQVSELNFSSFLFIGRQVSRATPGNPLTNKEEWNFTSSLEKLLVNSKLLVLSG
jgi:hypothetical protein